MNRRSLTQAKKKALFVAETAQDHKALNLRVLHVTRHCDYADYFIIMSATSTRHAKALADAIAEELRITPASIEGYTNGEWVLLDLQDVVVHIFYEPVRSYYCLDKVWADAPSLDLTEPAAVSRRKSAAASART